jgi:ubiquinone/menaquinone biosynthesis C-methylase UbiE
LIALRTICRGANKLEIDLSPQHGWNGGSCQVAHDALEGALSKQDKRPSSWELFWAEAGVDGCTALFPAAAQQAIVARWRSYFTGLKPGSAILDLATGAGAVLVHAAQAQPNGATFRLVGTDLATRPPDQTHFTEYHGGIDAASLPFPDGSFDCVTSQFGIEYAGFETALEEAGRVCRGGINMLVHAAGGVVVRQNVLQADQADWILEELALPARLADHFEAPTPASAAAVDELLRKIRARGSSDENVTLLESVYAAALSTQQLWQRNGPEAARQALAALSGQLALHRDRMRLLGGAGINRSRLDAAAERLRNAGFRLVKVDEERFGADDHLVGYWLGAQKT